ncbi:hypothetical protein AMECASPLE_028478 [Ameca splendens]|uniref:Transmembrane protein n=1 Tax=Ameca splendens TaxID=208324 RepID=A0ABV0XUC7_9TELE
MVPSILRSAAVPPAAKHPRSMMPPPLYFTVGMFSGFQAFLFFLQMDHGQFDQTPSSDHRTSQHKLKPLSLSACCSWSNGFFLSEWPFSPCYCRTRFTVDEDFDELQQHNISLP